MRASQFHTVFGASADFWGSDPDHPVDEWQAEVNDDATRLGYWDWVQCQREQAAEEAA